MRNRIISKNHIMLTVLFALYMSEYMICLICMDKSAYDLEGTGEILHYLKMPAVAAGFLLFPVICRLGTDIRTRRIQMIAANIVFMAGMASVMVIGIRVGIVIYIISCGATLLSLGILGGSVYYYFAMGLTEHPSLGRLSGLGGAAAFLIQMAVLYVIPANAAMLVLLIAGFAFTAYITIGSKDRFDWMFDEPVEYAKKGDPALPSARIICTGILAMSFLYLICGLTDTILVSMNFAGDMAIYAWPRLFGAAGYLIAGFLADIGHKRWLFISALCLTILCIPLPFILKEVSLIAGTCIYYIIAVGLLEFMNVFFWELSPRTGNPRLVAGMSRTLASLSSVILPLFTYMSVIAFLMIGVVLIAAVTVCIAVGGFFPVVQVEDSRKARSGDDTDEIRLEEFAKQHGLTPRERDFLIPLIESDDDISVIASSMNISTRTVYRHINSIYEKTGTETRYALMRYYYQTK